MREAETSRSARSGTESDDLRSAVPVVSFALALAAAGCPAESPTEPLSDYELRLATMWVFDVGDSAPSYYYLNPDRTWRYEGTLGVYAGTWRADATTLHLGYDDGSAEANPYVLSSNCRILAEYRESGEHDEYRNLESTCPSGVAGLDATEQQLVGCWTHEYGYVDSITLYFEPDRFLKEDWSGYAPDYHVWSADVGSVTKTRVSGEQEVTPCSLPDADHLVLGSDEYVRWRPEDCPVFR